ncbi:GNAT family N-acetyltransferase [Clostridium sp. Marseille-P299]|uniref:GNAT family N-acetyltransferase n=1 Tax=Clostridium sp. Marseille-P299 TaxID=1805477 RepID=UPI00082E2664|nr:GNAT family N-acetyltransferase [Clostridium sp. Marseille-P299]
MPILGVKQPEYILVDDEIRLIKYNGKCEFALKWYQDSETLLLVDGKDMPYTIERLKRMYEYLNNNGELYFIEYMDDGQFEPIGDVTFCKDDMPIVIGERLCRGKKIGLRVINKLVERAKSLGYKRIYVDEIYDYNIGSRKCFEKVGFLPYEKTEKGSRYYCDL